MTDKRKIAPYQIDWTDGRVYHLNGGGTAQVENETTVTFCGDWGPLGEHAASLRRDPVKFYGDIPDRIGNSDLTIINIEFPVRNGEPLVKDGPAFGVEPDLLMTLPNLSCKIGCLANNHTTDYGEQGLLGTLQTLQQLNIQTVGAGTNLEEARRPLLYEVHGLKLAVVNMAEGEEAKATSARAGAAPLDVAFACDQIAKLSKSVDFVLVVIHAGREYVPVPPPYIQSAYRTIAESGADLIVAHHPHVPQGLEIWNNVPIFYSQGNFALLNRKKNTNYRNLGYLVQAKLTKSGITSIEIFPYKIDAGGLELLKGDVRSEFLQNLSTISSHLSPASVAVIWDAYADLWFESKFSGELRHFMQLMSWQALCGGVSDRLRTQAKQQRGMAKVISNTLARGLQRLSTGLSNKNKTAVAPAAIFRNRFDTWAHRELYQTVLRRLIDGRMGSSPQWAQELLSAWRSLE